MPMFMASEVEDTEQLLSPKTSKYTFKSRRHQDMSIWHIRSTSASMLRLLKISVISKLRRFCFSLSRMFRSCVASTSICILNTKMFVQS